MTDFWNIQELVELAYRQLSRNEWDFIVGGTETETTLRRNRLALDSLALRPRVLRNVSQIDWSSNLFGRKLRVPLIMAPIGKQQYHGGAATVAKVAADFGCTFALSSVNAMTSIEHIASAAPQGTNIYQLYVRGNREWVIQEVNRAVAAGCAAVCVTVDTALISRRERDFANRYTSLGRRRFEGAAYQAGFDWSELAHLREVCKLPLIVKGIVDPSDAEQALALGVDGIYVSNHGGRQIDHTVGAVDCRSWPTSTGDPTERAGHATGSNQRSYFRHPSFDRVLLQLCGATGGRPDRDGYSRRRGWRAKSTSVDAFRRPNRNQHLENWNLGEPSSGSAHFCFQK
jgi:glycolate oxidase